MNNSAQNPKIAHELVGKVDQQLSKSLETLEIRLSRVERGLNLGCQNLNDLVNTRDSDIRKQLDYLQGGLVDLHSSLAEARSLIASARGDTTELQEVLPEPDPGSQDEASKNKKPEIDHKLAAKIRHDEPITLGGIIRALLMADAPEQRLSS